VESRTTTQQHIDGIAVNNKRRTRRSSMPILTIGGKRYVVTRMMMMEALTCLFVCLFGRLFLFSDDGDDGVRLLPMWIL
jgi:hypothetical protein